MAEKYKPAKVVSRSGAGQNITFKQGVLFVVVGTLIGSVVIFNIFAADGPAEPAPVANPVPAKQPSLSPADAIAMEKRNEAKIREFIADEKTLPKRNYETRVDFWKEITAMAPANAEYSKKLAEAERNLAEVRYATQNPEQGMQVEKVDGRKAGFNNVLVIDITLRNDSLSNLKDFQISCESKGPSGSVLGVNDIVLYETVDARETQTFRKVNMGLLNQQAKSTQCEVIQSSIG